MHKNMKKGLMERYFKDSNFKTLVDQVKIIAKTYSILDLKQAVVLAALEKRVINVIRKM